MATNAFTRCAPGSACDTARRSAHHGAAACHDFGYGIFRAARPRLPQGPPPDVTLADMLRVQQQMMHDMCCFVVNGRPTNWFPYHSTMSREATDEH